MAKGKNGGGFSTRRENAVEGGGGNIAVVKEIGWVEEFTYGGRHKDKPSAALRTVFEFEGGEKKTVTWEDHWPVGPSSQFEVSRDGYTITRTSGPKGLNKASAAFFFFDHLQGGIEAGELNIDEYVVEDEDGVCVQALEGLTVRLENKPFVNVSGDTKDKKVIVEILVDEPATTKKNGKASKGKPASSDDIEDKTVEAVSALLEDNTTIKKGDLANLIYEANRKDADVKAMMNLAFKDAWVSSDDRPWDFDKKRGILKARD